MRAAITLVFVSLTVLLSGTAGADVPTGMNIQGRLTHPNGAPVANQELDFTFKIFDAASGGSEIWPNGPGEAQTLTTEWNGLWTAELGSMIPLTGLVFQDTARWLEVSVDNGVTVETLSRIRLLSVPFNFQSASHLWVLDDSILTTVGRWGISRGGFGNTVAPGDSTHTHVNLGAYSHVGYDGLYNTISGGDSTSNIFGSYNTVSGGHRNLIFKGQGNTISGGMYNSHDEASYGVIGGGTNNINLAVLGGVIGGGDSNTISKYAVRGVIAGGRSNCVCGDSHHGAIVGGEDNTVGEDHGFIGGGQANLVVNNYGTVAGGSNNSALGSSCSIGGGSSNSAGGQWPNMASFSTVAGGSGNAASGDASAIGGGQSNIASGEYSTIPGGQGNLAAGHYSMAAGRRAKADSAGSFVWADASGFDFHCDTANQFAVRATGGVRIVTEIDETGTAMAGVLLPAGASDWLVVSDSSMKVNLISIDGADVLEKIAQLPLWQWNYRTQSASVQHVGPTAQDFRRLFGLGQDEKTISSMDPAGIALAAIKELNTQNQQLIEQNEELLKRMDALEAQLRLPQAR